MECVCGGGYGAFFKYPPPHPIFSESFSLRTSKPDDNNNHLKTLMAEWKYGIMLNLFKYLQSPIPMARS